MNREEAKALLPVITAFAEGKDIQFKPLSAPNSTWESSPPDWTAPAGCYRIKPEKQERWINIYELNKHETKEKADSNAAKGRIACIRIEYTPGEGL